MGVVRGEVFCDKNEGKTLPLVKDLQLCNRLAKSENCAKTAIYELKCAFKSGVQVMYPDSLLMADGFSQNFTLARPCKS